jgi:hypothetical protein
MGPDYHLQDRVRTRNASVVNLEALRPNSSMRWADEHMTGRSEGLNPEAETTGTATRNWAARHDLVLYFVLAYVLSWALWPLVILNPTSSPVVPFGPLIAAVIVALLAGGRRELWALLGQLTRWRLHPIWYVLALLGPFVLAALTALLAIAAGAPAHGTGAYPDWHAIGFFFLSTLIIVGLFEEVGWRGFALPRLRLIRPVGLCCRSSPARAIRSCGGSWLDCTFWSRSL